MKEMVLTRFEIVTETVGKIGFGGLGPKGWVEYVRALLEDNGFDLARTIEIHEDFATASYTYRQKDTTDNATRTTTT